MMDQYSPAELVLRLLISCVSDRVEPTHQEPFHLLTPTEEDLLVEFIMLNKPVTAVEAELLSDLFTHTTKDLWNSLQKNYQEYVKRMARRMTQDDG